MFAALLSRFATDNLVESQVAAMFNAVLEKIVAPMHPIMRSGFDEALLICCLSSGTGLSLLEHGGTASLLPREHPTKDVQISLQARLPGGLDEPDWAALLELLSAVKAALPNDERKPGEIAELVTEALRSHQAPMIDATRLEHADKT